MTCEDSKCLQVVGFCTRRLPGRRACIWRSFEKVDIGLSRPRWPGSVSWTHFWRLSWRQLRPLSSGFWRFGAYRGRSRDRGNVFLRRDKCQTLWSETPAGTCRQRSLRWEADHRRRRSQRHGCQKLRLAAGMDYGSSSRETGTRGSQALHDSCREL